MIGNVGATAASGTANLVPQSALDGHSGFDHAFIMSVQTKSRGQRGMRAPLHRRTALPPGSEHASHSQNLDFS